MFRKPSRVVSSHLCDRLEATIIDNLNDWREFQLVRISDRMHMGGIIQCMPQILPYSTTNFSNILLIILTPQFQLQLNHNHNNQALR